MNILLVTQFLSATKGGGEYLFSLIANELAKRGHRVWIITHRIENEDYTNFHENVKIEFVSSIKYEGGLPPSFADNIKFVLQAIARGNMLIKREKIQVIHSNNFSPALASSILSYFTGVPHVTAMWDIFSLCGDDYWTSWGKQKGVSKLHVFLGPRFERLILKMRHSAIHTISKASEEDLIKFGAKKPIFVIEPTIRTIEYPTVEPNILQFVYVGRLVFYKNLETVIRSISIVKKSYEKIKLKIIGGGPQKEDLLNLTKQLDLQDNIEFSGFVSEDTKYKAISSSLAMVFPSLCEGFGLVILESFLCERPVLVSNVRPLSDIIQNNRDGFVIDAKDERKWAEVMMNIIRDEKNALNMGKYGKLELETRYNIKNSINQIESMYQAIVSNIV